MYMRKLQETSERKIVRRFLTAFPNDIRVTMNPILYISAPEKPRREAYNLVIIYHMVL